MRKWSPILSAIALALVFGCVSPDGDDTDHTWNIDESSSNEGTSNLCPDGSDGYDYLSTNPDSCEQLQIECPDEQQVPFSDDECGCGCVQTYTPGNPPEQAPDCPTEEDGYRYVGDSPEICADIDFTCDFEAGEEGFHNDCGCGCIEGDPSVQPIQCPAGEDGYDYVSEDPEECAVIFFDCDSDQEHFFDEDCGCGCVDAEGPTCAPQEATGHGDACPGEPLYAFDGSECVNVVAGHCYCEGADCTELPHTRQECEETFSHCSRDRCEPMDAAGDGEMCDGFYGYSYQGGASVEEACQPMNGCECVGDDCDDAFWDFDECAAYHESCTE